MNFVLFSKNFEKNGEGVRKISRKARDIFLRRRQNTEKEKEDYIIFVEEKKNAKGKGGKYLEKETIYFAEEKEKQEAKGGQYLEKENCKRLSGQCRDV